MKTKKILSMLMVCALFFCCTFTVANAETNLNDDSHIHIINDEITFVFDDEISEYARNKIVSDFTGSEEISVETRGLTCTLFGHKLETGTTTTITHKVRSTAPRCLQERFEYEICTRCDYSNYTLFDSEYIYCCS